MNINNFRYQIERDVFEAGRVYYNNCQVSYREAENNVYIAIVGVERQYTVVVKLKNNGEIIKSECDCSDCNGDFCKHQIAVLLILSDHRQEILQSSDYRSILESRNPDELVDLLVSITGYDEKIRRHIQFQFIDANDTEEIRQAREVILAYADFEFGSQGQKHCRSIYDVERGAEVVLDKAQEVRKRKHTIRAVNLVVCVISEMTVLLEDMNDVDGVIKEVVDKCFHFIGKMIKNDELKSTDKTKIFRKLAVESTDEKYDDSVDIYDSRLGYLQLCANLSDTQNRLSELRKLVGLMVMNQKKKGWGTYFCKRAIKIVYDKIEQSEGSTKAENFLEQFQND